MTRKLSWITILVVAAGMAAAGAAQSRAGHADDDRTRGGLLFGGRNPIVIAHRGASGDRPEHTLAAYEHAADLGADYIEPDLVPTKDGVLVARHENEIGGTTDVAARPEFAARKTTKTIDGVPTTGWFTEDFTLAELKTLRAKERIPLLRPQNTAFDGLYEVPTLQEVIDLAKRKGVGIYPETKHPTYFDSIGLSLEEPLVATLQRNGWNKRTAPVYIQSFEVANLKQLDGMTKVKIVQLLNAGGKPYDFTVAKDPRTYADMATPAGLEAIADYADGIGANKNLIVPRDASNHLLAPTSLIEDAHDVGLVVHAWTFRNENEFLAAEHRRGNPLSPVYRLAMGNAAAEYRLFYGLGFDGLFSDNTDTAVAARTELAGGRHR
ncbi:MAG: glycerophosphodiester phosphodiesterase [Gaiellaceae bacterium]